MKLFFVGDLHLGRSNASEIFENEFIHFAEKILFPRLKKESDNKALIFLGDIFDNRQHLNVRTISLFKSFMDEIESMKIPTFLLIGNHDIFFRRKLHPNSVTPLVREFQFISAVDEFSFLKFPSGKIDLVPWICETNRDEIISKINESNSQFIAGHFEISGFQMNSGQVSTDGLKQSFFKDFHKVFSGHFHHRSHKGNILFTGTPFQQSWDEVFQRKGFFEFSVENSQLKFIENDKVLFKIINVKDEIPPLENLAHTIVRVNLFNTPDDVVKELISRIEDQSPHSVQLNDVFENEIIHENEQFSDDHSFSVRKIIMEFLENVEIQDSKIDKRLVVKLFEKMRDDHI